MWLPACEFADDPKAAWTRAGDLLVSSIAVVWQRGWQPNELVRHVRRSVSRGAAELMMVAILVDDSHREGQSKHPRWQRQIDELQNSVQHGVTGPDWIVAEADSTGDSVDAVMAVTDELAGLGSILRLIPPLGETHVDVGLADDDTDDPVLAKIRALLAQAESTSFPAEAESFTAKVQALMSRHAIDEAIIRHAVGNADRPVTVRLPVDDPYVSEQSTLLSVVADASRCRAVSLGSYAMSTLTGQTADVRQVELLFTSLLLQAQAALNHEAATGGAGSHRRSRRFRAAFLAGYSQRIRDRLFEERERERAEAAAGADALPVLARQSATVDDEIDRLFGDRLTFGGAKSCNRAGWNSGSEAADRAHLRESGVGPAGQDKGLRSG